MYNIATSGWHLVIRIGSSTILARWLTPDDFGLFGIAIIIREFLQHTMDVGVSTGIIAKKEVDENDLSTAFWISSGIRILMFLIGISMAPVAAYFFNDDRASMLVRLVSITFLFSILSNVPRALLRRRFRFDVLAIVQSVSIVIESGIAVILVLTTNLGYWALAISLLAGSLFIDLSFCIWARWRPRFKFSKSSYQYLIKFGLNNLGFTSFNYLQQNIDYIIIGKFLGTKALGLYEFAYRIPHLVVEKYAAQVSATVLPILSTVQTENRRIAAGYVKTAKFIAYITFPALSGLVALASPAVYLLWGKQWESITVPLQILCISAALRSVAMPAEAILLCKNKPNLLFKLSIFTFTITALSIGFLGFFFGINGVAFGMLISTVAYLSVIYLAFKVTSQPLFTLLHGLSPPAISATICFFCTFSMRLFLDNAHAEEWVVVLASTFTGVTGYLVSLYFLFRHSYTEIKQTIETVLSKK